MMIALGSDLLSAKSNPSMKAILEGLGRLGNKLDRVGDKKTRNERTGVVMEMRRMRDGVGPGEWQDLALEVFDYIAGLNKSAKRPTATHDRQARNRRSTSVNTAGCSECTQCPAPLIVTRRLRGN